MADKVKSSENVIQDIKRETRRVFDSDEKIPVVLEGSKGEESVASICRREPVNTAFYYKWSKEFLMAGKRRPAGDTVR